MAVDDGLLVGLRATAARERRFLICHRDSAATLSSHSLRSRDANVTSIAERDLSMCVGALAAFDGNVSACSRCASGFVADDEVAGACCKAPPTSLPHHQSDYGWLLWAALLLMCVVASVHHRKRFRRATPTVV